MTSSTHLLLFLALCAGTSVSMPATKLEPVKAPEIKSNISTSTKLETGRIITDRVELSLPLKISKEELVGWITHAMRIMASRINVTLATINPDAMPTDRMDKLRNCSIALNHLIDKMSSRNSTKKTERVKSSMPSGFKQYSSAKDPKTKSDCKRSEESKSAKLCDKPRNHEVTTSPLAQSFSKNAVTNNPISKFVQELTIVKPYDDASSQIFRDPNVFPPYDAKHRISLPLESDHSSARNITSRIGQSVGPLKLDGGALPTSFQNSLDLTHLNNVVKGVLARQYTTGKPVISLPFEAVITINRDDAEPLPRTTKKSWRNKVADSRHEASTSDSPEFALPEEGLATKKGKTSGKTTVVFEDEETTVASDDDGAKENKNGKKKTRKKALPAGIQFILRMLNRVAKNNSAPAGEGNLFAKSKSKPTRSKLVQFLRGTRNESQSEKQIEDDDDDDPLGGNGNEDYEYEELGGSLGSLEDIIPLVIPILEDISDPESDTDLGEFLAAAIPLVQGLLEPDSETGQAPDIVGVLGPIIQGLILGKDGMGSDFGAILGPIIQLVGPFIGPLVGPIIGPLSSQLSGGQGISLAALLSSLLAPLSQPTEHGGLSPIAVVTGDVISIILKEVSKPGSDLDVGELVSQVVTGVISGASAGLSGGSKSKHPNTGYGAPAAYGPPPKGGTSASQVELFQPPPPPSRSGKSQQKKAPRFRSQATQYRPQATHPETPVQPQVNYEQLAAPANYGNYGAYGVPANTVHPFSLLTSAFKDIIASGVNLFTAVLSASTASSGASSQESGGHGHPGYGYGPTHGGHGYQKVDSYQNIK